MWENVNNYEFHRNCIMNANICILIIEMSSEPCTYKFEIPIIATMFFKTLQAERIFVTSFKTFF